MAILLCAHCGSGYASLGEVPLKCWACDRVTTWTNAPTVAPPTIRYDLTYMDRRFLRSIKVQTDEPSER